MTYLFIPTKGRAENKITSKMIEAFDKLPVDYRVILVVLPSEVKSYQDVWGQRVGYLELEEEILGYSYAFYSILKFCFTNSAIDRFFIIDDDIQNLYYKNIEKKQRTFGLDKLETVLDYFKEVPYFYSGLSFKQTQWVNDKDYADFGRVSAFIHFNKSKVSREFLDILLHNIETEYNVKEYRLYLIAYLHAYLLKNGVKGGIIYKYAFSCPTMAKNEQGGCFNDHTKTEQPLKCATQIVKLFGTKFAKIVNNKGRTEVQILWKKLYEYYQLLNNISPLF